MVNEGAELPGFDVCLAGIECRGKLLDARGDAPQSLVDLSNNLLLHCWLFEGNTLSRRSTPADEATQSSVVSSDSKKFKYLSQCINAIVFD